MAPKSHLQEFCIMSQNQYNAGTLCLCNWKQLFYTVCNSIYFTYSNLTDWLSSHWFMTERGDSFILHSFCLCYLSKHLGLMTMTYAHCLIFTVQCSRNSNYIKLYLFLHWSKKVKVKAYEIYQKEAKVGRFQYLPEWFGTISIKS